MPAFTGPRKPIGTGTKTSPPDIPLTVAPADSTRIRDPVRSQSTVIEPLATTPAEPAKSPRTHDACDAEEAVKSNRNTSADTEVAAIITQHAERLPIAAETSWIAVRSTERLPNHGRQHNCAPGLSEIPIKIRPTVKILAPNAADDTLFANCWAS